MQSKTPLSSPVRELVKPGGKSTVTGLKGSEVVSSVAPLPLLVVEPFDKTKSQFFGIQIFHRRDFFFITSSGTHDGKSE